MARKKTVDNNVTIKRKAVKKRTVDKKAMREKQQIIAEKAMDAARKGTIDMNVQGENFIEEEPEIVITREERAERFKRLNAIAQNMIKR